ncbi:hypothetical protein C8R45DRAFT_980318, partial [Mycena sanguinolenta]
MGEGRKQAKPLHLLILNCFLYAPAASFNYFPGSHGPRIELESSSSGSKFKSYQYKSYWQSGSERRQMRQWWEAANILLSATRDLPTLVAYGSPHTSNSV